MIPVFDSHAHLTADRFTGDVEGVVARARAAGVEGIATIGTDLEDSRAAVGLTASFPDVHASVGIHPHAASTATPSALGEIAELARHPRVVAIGETGLDYYYDNSPREQQRRAFLAHLELGRELALPVVVHSREADADLRDILREAGGGTRGVLHSFAGGAELMETALELGWYVSFSGMVTFKKYDGADRLRAVPRDRLLVETDSPYLAPVPHRGKRNEPAFVAFVAHRVAELRGEEAGELAGALLHNSRAFYALEGGED